MEFKQSETETLRRARMMYTNLIHTPHFVKKIHAFVLINEK